jgi:hypothetical protein
MKPRGLADLAVALEAGRYGWFQEEFGAAVAADVIGPRLWDRIVGGQEGGVRLGRQQVRNELERLWDRVLPGRAFPGMVAQGSAEPS